MDKGSLGAVRSGWMVDRLTEYVSAMDQTCDDRMGWIISWPRRPSGC